MNGQTSNHLSSDWLKNHPIISAIIVSIIVGIPSVVAIWLYIAQYRLSDFDKRMDEIKKVEADRWEANERRQQEQFAKVNATLAVLKINLFTVMQKSGQPLTHDQIKDLLSSIQNSASASGGLVKEAKVLRGTIEDLPSTAGWKKLNVAAGMREESPDIHIDTTLGNVQIISGGDTSKILTRLLVSDAVSWNVSNGTINASYVNGAVSFTPRDRQGLSELSLWVNDANTLRAGIKSIADTMPNLDKAKQ